MRVTPNVRRVVTLAAAFLAALALTGCEPETASQKRETKAKQNSYDQLVAGQPAGSMSYSPTRETINAWMTTWDEPGKLAFVYLQNGQGEYGYFVTVGPPVSYCAMLTPTYVWEKRPYGDHELVPAPGMDGAYYTGGQCNAYYAIDATTGAYLEFTVGANQSFFLYDQPMELPEFEGARQLGPTSVGDVE